MARVLLSAAHKSSGKTTISIGLCAALKQRGLTVQPFKKGPDYIDPLWLGAAAGRSCHNLDYWTQNEDEIKGMVANLSADADISVIEGNKGLYDGLDIDGSNSNAAIANLLETPVVLVIDTQGITRGIAPLLIGYQSFGPELTFAGVILNKVAGPRHEKKLRDVVEHYTDLPVLGAVWRNKDLEITERHLGLVPSFEHGSAAEKVTAAAKAVADGVDVEAVIQAAQTAPRLKAKPTTIAASRPSAVTIAIPKDEAFGFYYPDDLSALEATGAKLVFFDALKDIHLPPCDGLFIGGGFPETHMVELEANAPLREAIRSAVQGGLPTYAECGGLMYLARSITWNGETRQMVGAIEGDISMHDKAQGRGYVQLSETTNHPWGAADGSASINAHEFHYSRLENLDANAQFAYKVERGYGIDGEHDGLIVGNLLANYAHLRHTASNRWADRFIAFTAANQHRASA